ncbi:non-ribosomal peptide synthetase [Gordonia hydrophobica]|uniref:Non-ribosomal peptide synthetase n=1 Tax=Gordonia hydrophobica TaxID=40516 RepID=A0ABZ2U2T9_9ACTN|nr:non-ribosomal peptide synthetase [Gordonia hydrophobica]MBM7367312.1 amino acid adenylation domain-containing protein [Gordonia hydrophobica]
MTPEQLQSAVNAASRHPALRSAIATPDALIDIDRPAPTVRVHDLSADEDGGESALAAVRERMAGTYFRLDEGHAWDVELSLLGSGRSVIHLAVALTVADLIGITVLCAEIAAHIAVLRETGAEPDPAPRIDYADVRAALADSTPRRPSVPGDILATRVDELLEAPVLPMVDPGGPDVAPRVTRLAATLDDETWTRLGELAGDIGVTRAAILLAVYAEALRRWTDDERRDFIITVPGLSVAGTEAHILDRTRIYATRCIDRPDLSAADAFGESAAELRYRIARGVDAVDELRRAVATGAGHRGLAPYVLTYSADRPVLPAAATELLGHPTMIRSSTPQVIIDFQVYRFVADEVSLSFDVRDGVLADGVAEQLFATTVEAVTALADWSPEQVRSTRIADVVALPEQVRRHRELLSGERAAPPGLLHDDFRDAVARHPERVALVCADRQCDRIAVEHEALTYGDVDALARALAIDLIDRTDPDDIVALDLPKGPAQIVAALAVLYAGCTYLPMPQGLPESRRGAILDAARPTVILGPDDLPSTVAPAPGAEGRRDAAPAAPAYVIFTSGSTGTPKGVVMSHAAAVNTVRDVRDRNRIDADDALIPVAAMSFDLSVFDVFGVLGSGGRLICVGDAQARDPFVWLRLIDEHRVTIWNSAPMLAEMLAAAADRRTPPLPLRRVLCSGDRIDRGLYDRLAAIAPEVTVVAMGGATEGGIWSNEFLVGADTALRPEWASVPYGGPLTGQRYRVADADGRDCGAHVVGELWIGGESLASGYLGDPELTADRFVDDAGDRWYRTGDLGHWEADDVLVIHGRTDGQVKIRGHRIELGDVEAHLRRLPAVTDAVAFAFPGNTALGAAVVLSAPAEGATGDDIVGDAGRVLPAHMVPRRIDVWDALPVTGNGKVDRAAVATHAGDTRPTSVTIDETVDARTALVVAAYAELLPGPVDEHTNFFAAGGESLAAARLCRLLADAGHVITVADVLAAPSASALADLLSDVPSTPCDNAREVAVDTSVDRFPLTPLQRAYTLGRDGLRDQVRSDTLFTLVLSLPDHVGADDVHRAVRRLTDSWEGLRCARVGDGEQGVADAVDVPLVRVSGPLRDYLPHHRCRTVCAVVVSEQDPGEVGLAIDYLGLDARSLVTVVSAIIAVADGGEIPSRVLGDLAGFAVHARTPSPSSTTIGGRRPVPDDVDLRVPMRAVPTELTPFASRRMVLTDVDGLNRAADDAGVTPSVLLLHAFGATLSEALTAPRIPITVPISHRPVETAGAESVEVLGNFTRLETVIVDPAAGPEAVGAQLWGRIGSEDPAAPGAGGPENRIVFTSTLGLDYSTADAALTPVWSLTATPGVLLDCQVLDHPDGIEIRWDHPHTVLDPTFLDRAQHLFVERLGLTDERASIRASSAASLLTTEQVLDALEQRLRPDVVDDAPSAALLRGIADRHRSGLRPDDGTAHWTADDVDHLTAVLDGSVPQTALLEHPRLAPDAMLAATDQFGAFLDDVAGEIVAKAAALGRAIQVVELGASVGERVIRRLGDLGADHHWECVEPDRLLAHIAHRRGLPVRAEASATVADVIVIGGAAHRDPRILRILHRLPRRDDAVLWLCEPSLDRREILLSAAILNPAVLTQRVDAPLWHWCSVLRDRGFTPVRAVEHDSLVSIRAKLSITPPDHRLSAAAESPVASASTRTQPTPAPASVPAPTDTASDDVATIATAWREVLGLTADPEPHTDFFDVGGDSLSGTRVISRLAADGFTEARLVDLFNQPEFGAFAATVRRTGVEHPRVPSTSRDPHVAVGDDGAFPLTAVQRAYLAGRDSEQILGGNNAHCYFELSVDTLDIAALARAVDVVVARHPSLRSRTVDAWTGEVVVAHTNSAPLACADPRAATEAESIDPTLPGALRVRVGSDVGGSSVVGIGMDNLWLDGQSMFLVLDELSRAYRGEVLPSPVNLTPADYLAGHPELVVSAAPEDRVAAVARALPPAPRIWSRSLAGVETPRFDRVETLIPTAEWTQIRRWSAGRRVSPNALLLAAYVRVLGRWASTDALTVNVTAFDRDPTVPEAAALVGDFTRLFLVGATDVDNDFAALVQRVQQAVVRGMSEPEYATTEICRELLSSRGTPVDAMFPVVFTSGLGLSPTGRHDDEDRLFGRLERVRSQTPQVVLDLQVTEGSAGLRLTADFITELLGPDAVRDHLDELTAALRRCLLDPEQASTHDDGLHDRHGIVEQVTRAWSTTLGVSEIGADTNFFTSGGDSLKATALMRRLIEDGLGGLSLRTLLENPRFDDFLVAATATPAVTPTQPAMLDDDEAGDGFSLTEIQAGYLVGRTAAYADGGTGCQGYHQFDLVLSHPDASAGGAPTVERAPRLRAAWARVVDAHPMLRMRVDPDRFEQRVDPNLDVPLQVIECADRADADEESARLADRLVRHVYDPSEPRPLLDVVVVLGPDSAVLHVSVDLLVTDYVGLRIVIDDFDRALRGLDVRPPSATFGDYQRADRRRRQTPQYRERRRRAEQYWTHRIPDLSAPLRFRSAPNASSDGQSAPGYTRRSQHLSTAEWDRLCATAAGLEATPVALILGEFGAVAAAHAAQPSSTVMLTRVDRQPLVADIDRIVGDFTSTLMIEVPGGLDRATAVRRVRDEVFAALDHSEFSGVEVARLVAGDSRTQTVVPVVITYTVDAADSAAPRLVVPREGTGRSRTPQVLLDVQITPLPGGVAIDWDARDDGFDSEVLDAAFADFVERLRRVGAATTAVETALAVAHERLALSDDAVADLLSDSEQTVRDVMAWHLARAGMHRPIAVAEVARRLGAGPRTPLVRRWVEELIAAGMVKEYTHGVCLTAPAIPLADSLERWRSIRARAAEIDYGDRQLAYVEECLHSLEGLLNGSVDPLALLFPGGELEVARAAYDDNLLARYLNGVCAAGMRAAASGRSSLRVLEVGGGVGGTTRTVLDELAGHRVDYLFTDVSRFFLDAAEQRWPQVSTALFDVNDDRAPSTDGFDVILCANVLHNAHDIPAAVARLRRLLRPGGALAIIDSTAPSAALMATMEFKEGLADRRDLRAETGSPFLLLSQWCDVLAEDQVAVYPPSGHVLETAGQHLFWVTPAAAASQAAPHERESQVAQIWSEVLDVPVAGLTADSDFMTSGGDSLLLARCVGRLRRELDWAEPSAWDLVYRRVVADPTIAGCVAALTGRSTTDRRVPEPALTADPHAWVDTASRRDAVEAGLDGPTEARLVQLVAPTAVSATPIVLFHDGSGGLGPYRELVDALGTRIDGGVYGIERSPGDGYLDIPAEDLFAVLQQRCARSLLRLHASSIHLVGYCMGGLLAAGTAPLLEAHGITPIVTVISSYRIPFRLTDDVLADYAFAKALGWDPADFGIDVDDDHVGATLTDARAAGHRTIDAEVVAEHGPGSLTDALRAAPPTVLDRVRCAVGARGRDGITEEVLLGMRETFVHSVSAVAAWRQPVMVTPATFLRQEKPMSYLPSLGEDMSDFWRSHCVGGLDVVDIPGDHFSCLNGANASSAAQLLAELTLATADQEVR